MRDKCNLKIALLVTLISMSSLLSPSIHAQSISLGPSAGVQLSEFVFKSKNTADQTTTTDFAIGYHLGVSVNVMMHNHIDLQTGLCYSAKGFLLKEEERGATGQLKGHLGYIELPVNVIFKTGEEAGNRFYAGIGGYVGYGIAGNLAFTSDPPGSVLLSGEVGSIRWGSDKNSQFRRLDAGVNLLLGYQLKNSFFATAQATKGLLNIAADQHDEITKNNITLRFTIGYLFKIKNKNY